MASASNFATDKILIFEHFLAGSVKGMVFVTINSVRLDFSIRLTASPDRTGWVMEA
jgi:hypothetical protein